MNQPREAREPFDLAGERPHLEIGELRLEILPTRKEILISRPMQPAPHSLGFRVDMEGLILMVDRHIAGPIRERVSPPLHGRDQRGEIFCELRLRSLLREGEMREQLLMIDKQVRVLHEQPDLALLLSTIYYLD